MSERGRSAGWPTWLAVGTIMAGLAVVLLIGGRPVYGFLSNQAQVRAWVAKLGPWGPGAVVFLEITQAVLGPIPGTAIEAASGYLFGPWPGALYALLGIVLGSAISFGLARQVGRPLLLRWLSPRQVARLDDLTRRGGALFFFLIWLFPFVPDDLACLAAGLTPMSPRQFLLLMIAGRTPGILVATWLGATAPRLGPAWWPIMLAAVTLAAVVAWRWGEQIQDRLLSLGDQPGKFREKDKAG